MVWEGCEQGQLSLPTANWTAPFGPTGRTNPGSRMWAASGRAPLGTVRLQYLRGLPWRRRVSESCFLARF